MLIAPLTAHARVRMQQRGISLAALDVLLEYGREAHDHHGCRIVLGPRFPRFERYFGAYAVISSDDAVVTVGHRQGKK